MSIHAIIPHIPALGGHHAPHAQDRGPLPRAKRSTTAPFPIHFSSFQPGDESTYRQAELFYLQKQIQSQTPMVIVLEDGEKIEGCIEWYDRNCLKIRGRAKTLVYKSAIKYMYKVGEQGT